MELAEEAILGALSPDEIASLVDQLEEIDPENELLPAGQALKKIENFSKSEIFEP